MKAFLWRRARFDIASALGPVPTEFRLRVPLSPESQAGICCTNVAIGFRGIMVESSLAMTNKRNSDAGAPPRTILVVDADDVRAKKLRAELERRGFAVSVRRGGAAEAVASERESSSSSPSRCSPCGSTRRAGGPRRREVRGPDGCDVRDQPGTDPLAQGAAIPHSARMFETGRSLQGGRSKAGGKAKEVWAGAFVDRSGRSERGGIYHGTGDGERNKFVRAFCGVAW